MACGQPPLAVIAGVIGVENQLVFPGWHFNPGDDADLARVVGAAMTQDTTEMRTRTRQKYLDDFSPKANHERLIQIYDNAIDIRTAQENI